MLWIPPGFAHGFLVTSDSAEFLYKTTDYWVPEDERTIVWNDPDLAIDWPLGGPARAVREGRDGECRWLGPRLIRERRGAPRPRHSSDAAVRHCDRQERGADNRALSRVGAFCRRADRAGRRQHRPHRGDLRASRSAGGQGAGLAGLRPAKEPRAQNRRQATGCFRSMPTNGSVRSSPARFSRRSLAARGRRLRAGAPVQLLRPLSSGTRAGGRTTSCDCSSAVRRRFSDDAVHERLIRGRAGRPAARSAHAREHP